MSSLPTFFIVGAAKTGTSWMHQCLDAHPQVFVPHQGETTFFSYHYERGLEWYKRFFESSKQVEAVGEKSPSYMVTPKVPERIHDLVAAQQVVKASVTKVSRPAQQAKNYR